MERLNGNRSGGINVVLYKQISGLLAYDGEVIPIGRKRVELKEWQQRSDRGSVSLFITQLVAIPASPGTIQTICVVKIIRAAVAAALNHFDFFDSLYQNAKFQIQLPVNV